MLSGGIGPVTLAEKVADEVRLTVFVGRQERAAGPAGLRRRVRASAPAGRGRRHHAFLGRRDQSRTTAGAGLLQFATQTCR